MRTFFAVGLFGMSVLAGCGSDANEGPGTGTGGSNPGTGGSNPGTGGSNPGTGGSSPGTGGTTIVGGGSGGTRTGTGGSVGPGGNQYPDGETVNACFGDCPKGECDDEGFWTDTPCSGIYPTPIDASSSYCDAGDAAYCLEVGGSFGEMYGVQCVGGKATVRLCEYTCGSDPSGFECE